MRGNFANGCAFILHEHCSSRRLSNTTDTRAQSSLRRSAQDEHVAGNAALPSVSISLDADLLSGCGPMRGVTLLLVLVSGAPADAADRHSEAKAIIAGQCASCHRVPGVPGATGDVGPSLQGIARQQIIAGKLPNTRANMIRWLMHPQQVVPGNAMPEMGLTQEQARKIVAYLYTLDKR
jgi:cytochrome c2